LAADAITSDKIAAGAIVAESIAADAVTSAKIGTDQVTANKIAASSIITSKIATGAVTAAKISVSELSAISADLGTIQVDTAHIDNAAITSAKIASSIQSDNYSAGSAGWKIKKDGSAEFNGVVISRQLMVDSGTFTASSFTCNPNSSFDIDKTYNLETTSVPISAWSGTNFTYLATAGLSNVATFGTTSQIPDIYWGVRTVVLPLTKWSGSQTLRLRFEIWGKNLTGMGNASDGSYPPSGNFNINWKIYKVT
jgi:hypothetical protein